MVRRKSQKSASIINRHHSLKIFFEYSKSGVISWRATGLKERKYSIPANFALLGSSKSAWSDGMILTTASSCVVSSAIEKFGWVVSEVALLTFDEFAVRVRSSQVEEMIPV